MKKFPFGFSICLLLFFLAAALPAGASVDCGTFSNYAQLELAGSCTLGSGAAQLTFSDFTFTPSASGVGILPTATQLTFSTDNGAPATPPSTDTIWGFEFNPDLTVSGTGSEDINITYTITASSAIISSLHLFVNEATSGGGVATVTEDDTCSPPATPCNLFAGSDPPATSNHVDLEGFGPDETIDVNKNIDVTSLSSSGFAEISDARDAVDLTIPTPPVPEPTTISYFFLGVGFLAIGWRRRKTAKRQAH